MALINFGHILGGFTGRPHPTPVPVLPVTGPGGFSALIYQCKLNVDWDGSPQAYGLDRPDIPKGQQFPKQKALQPYEVAANYGSLLNAKSDDDHTWVGVFSRTPGEARQLLRDQYPGFRTMKPEDQESIFQQFLDTREHTVFGSLKDPNGRFPVVQLREMGGVKEGYYVSICNFHTGATDDAWSQNRYVDAATVPYAAVPSLPRVRLGDFGLIIRNSTGNSIAFCFGDTGAGTHLGECSGAVKLALAPERNGEDDTFTFIAFPRSGTGAADANALGRIDDVVQTEISKIADTGNVLAKRIAPRNPALFNIQAALRDKGGPQIVY